MRKTVEPGQFELMAGGSSQTVESILLTVNDLSYRLRFVSGDLADYVVNS